MKSDKDLVWRFKKIEKALGASAAYFYTCIIGDIPYVEAALPEEGEPDGWNAYIANLSRFMDWEAEKKGFLDGTTDISSVLKNSTDQMEKWMNTWGEGLSVQDYQRLDSLFDTYAARLQRAGGMDAQQEDTLRVCSRMRFEADKALSAGGKDNIDIAAKLNKMIQDNLSAENLRKKDEKPVEDLRIDTIVDKLEKAGFLRKGKILSLPELQKQLLIRLGALGGNPSHKYPYTLDAADQMIHIIINTMRANDGMPEMTEFTDNTRLDENVAPEFAESPNEDELKAYEALEFERQPRPPKEERRKYYGKKQGV